MKRFISIILSVLLIFSMFVIMGSAENNESVTAKFLVYNVAGLPNIDNILGKGGKDTGAFQEELGKQLNKTDYDVIAVQEDFLYHNRLVDGMGSYKNRTPHYGFLGGDGLCVFTKSAPIYNAKRTAWDAVGGPLVDGDMLTPKGFLHTVLDLGNGITVDFYDLHADAFDGDDNALAREKQYNQLMDYIDIYSANRPVIITGDFNTSLHIQNVGDNAKDEEAMLELFHNRGGFKDAWIEQYNDGDTANFSKWYATGVHYWGHWDSVEKFYYRSGAGIEIDATDFEYINFYMPNNENISDHSSAQCTFTFTKTADFQADTRSMKVERLNPFAKMAETIKWFFKDLIAVFQHWDEVKGYIGL